MLEGYTFDEPWPEKTSASAWATWKGEARDMEELEKKL